MLLLNLERKYIDIPYVRMQYMHNASMHGHTSKYLPLVRMAKPTHLFDAILNATKLNKKSNKLKKT